MLAALCMLLVVGALPASAGPVEDAITSFANDSYSDTDEAIAALVASGDPRALPIITALRDERLLADTENKKVYIKDDDGKVADAVTGQVVASSFANLDAVRLNNRLRGMVDAALGSLNLFSLDQAKRIEAAQSVFKSPMMTDRWRCSKPRCRRRPMRRSSVPSRRRARRSSCPSRTRPKPISSMRSPSSRVSATRTRSTC